MEKDYCYGDFDVARLDVYVICKLCTVLDCKIEDLLEFHPYEEQE